MYKSVPFTACWPTSDHNFTWILLTDTFWMRHSSIKFKLAPWKSGSQFTSPKPFAGLRFLDFTKVYRNQPPDSYPTFWAAWNEKHRIVLLLCMPCIDAYGTMVPSHLCVFSSTDVHTLAIEGVHSVKFGGSLNFPKRIYTLLAVLQYQKQLRYAGGAILKQKSRLHRKQHDFLMHTKTVHEYCKKCFCRAIF